MAVIASNLPNDGTLTDFSQVSARMFVAQDNNGHHYIVDPVNRVRYILGGTRQSGSLHAALQMFGEIGGQVFLTGYTQKNAVEAFGGPGGMMERVVAGLLPVPSVFRDAIQTTPTGFIANPQVITSGQGIVYQPPGNAGDVDTFTPPTTPNAPSTPAPEPAEPRDFNAEAAMLFPWLHKSLRDIYVEEWSKTGDANLAWAKMRQSDAYDKHFAGNRRDDGTLRYSEQEYLSVMDGYERALHQYGVGARAFRTKFVDLLEGDVSVNEFASRVAALNDRIVQSPEQIREAFAAEFGIDANKVTKSSILAVALDPDIGNAVLERRISISELTGQADRFGFERSRTRVQRLLDAGLDPSVAAQFYERAALALPGISGQSLRFNEGTFGIGEFEDALAMGDVGARRQIERLAQREQSIFSRQANVQSDQSGALTGLGTG